LLTVISRLLEQIHKIIGISDFIYIVVLVLGIFTIQAGFSYFDF
jgi:hypothetical protein